MNSPFLDHVENNLLGNIPHPALITLLCIKGGVTFSETEEKCLRSSPLTLKQEKEREMPREAIPVVEEEPETEKWGRGGGFGDYLEQPVLSPRAEETIPA